MSSRNGYLSDAEKATASVIFAAMNKVKDALEQGNKDFAALISDAEQLLVDKGFTPDYFAICAKETLAPASQDDTEVVILVAAF